MKWQRQAGMPVMPADIKTCVSYDYAVKSNIERRYKTPACARSGFYRTVGYSRRTVRILRQKKADPAGPARILTILILLLDELCSLVSNCCISLVPLERKLYIIFTCIGSIHLEVSACISKFDSFDRSETEALP